LVFVIAAGGNSKAPLVDESSQIENHQVEYHARAGLYLFIDTEIREVKERIEVFLIVNRTVPFAEAESQPVIEPLQEAGLHFLHVLSAGQIALPNGLRSFIPIISAGAKDPLRPHLSRKILRRGKKDLMIFGPVRHFIFIRIIAPVLV